MKLTDEQRRTVEENLWLVQFVMRKVRYAIVRSGLSMDDAHQIGCEALCKVVTRWDPQRGALSTYAVPWIRGEILKYCTTNTLISASSSTMRRRPELYNAVVSLQAPVGDTDDLTLGDLLPANADTERRSIVSEVWDLFSPREQQVLSGVLDGHRRPEIAQAVGMNQRTISAALGRIRQKTSLYLAQCAE